MKFYVYADKEFPAVVLNSSNSVADAGGAGIRPCLPAHLHVYRSTAIGAYLRRISSAARDQRLAVKLSNKLSNTCTCTIATYSRKILKRKQSRKCGKENSERSKCPIQLRISPLLNATVTSSYPTSSILHNLIPYATPPHISLI